MVTNTLHESFLEFWNRQTTDRSTISLDLDLDIQKKVLSLVSVGEFYCTVFNMISGDIEYVSPEVEQILGIRPKELTLPILAGRIHPDDRLLVQSCEATAKQFFADLDPEKYFHYKVRYDYRLMKHNGSYARFLQQAIPINYSTEGQVIHTFVVYTDISHLKTDQHPSLSFVGLNGKPSFIDYPILNYPHPKHARVFTPREAEILAMLWEGLESREIAEKHFISKDTVDTHRRTMLKKAGAKNTLELIRFAINTGEL